MTDTEREVIEAAINLWANPRGVPGLNASKRLDRAVEALLAERKASNDPE